MYVRVRIEVDEDDGTNVAMCEIGQREGDTLWTREGTNGVQSRVVEICNASRAEILAQLEMLHELV